jgi:hypothetical protein
MRKHYIIRIGNGKNLKNTRRFGAFALNSKEFTVKKYIELFKLFLYILFYTLEHL